jgi:hypothetical protein
VTAFRTFLRRNIIFHSLARQRQKTMCPRQEETTMTAFMSVKPTAIMSRHCESGSGAKLYTPHNYTDHYYDPVCRGDDVVLKDEQVGYQRRGPRGGVLVPFPEKLYNMLKMVQEDGFDEVVSWQPHGRCFAVRDPKKFVKEVMPK